MHMKPGPAADAAAAPPLDTPVQPQTRSQSHGIRSSAKQRGWAHAAHILAAAEKDLEVQSCMTHARLHDQKCLAWLLACMSP